MNHRATSFILAGVATLGLACTTARADSGQVSPERLEVVDQMGYFTPAFKASVHDLIDTKALLVQTQAENTKLMKQLPELKAQVTTVEAQAVALRQELAKYEHPDETDFAALQLKMSDPAAKPDDQIALAQAYVWTYPTSPHASDAQQYLQQTEKKVADAQQAIKDADAARAAAHAKLVARAQAKDLSLAEWRDFLRDMSEDDLVKLLGQPDSQTQDYWDYAGGWVNEPTAGKRFGMQVNFDAGRVLSVDLITTSVQTTQ